MTLFNLWELNLPLKTLYSFCMDPVCKKYNVNRTELDILLFLANNPQYDTAADIVNVRFLARSHVSISIRELERLGYLEGRYNPGNHKTIHLSILEPAAALVADGQRAQQDFYSILFQDADPADAEAASRFLHCVSHNIRSYLESREKL